MGTFKIRLLLLAFPLLALAKELAPPSGPISLSRYPTRIDEYRKKTEKYMAEKKKACQDKSGKSAASKKPSLSCLKQLKEERKTFIRHLYGLRKQYLIDLHQNQLEQLERGKNTLLRSLQTPPKKRRRRRR